MANVFRRHPRILIFIVTMLILIGCGLYFSHTIITTYRVYQQQRLWATHMPPNYRYQLTQSCFCPIDFVEPVLVEVRNGQTTSITYVNNDKPLTSSVREGFDNVATVDKLFHRIQAAANTGAVRIIVVYDTQLGYPRYIDIDEMRYAVDDEVTYSIDHFEIFQ